MRSPLGRLPSTGNTRRNSTMQPSASDLFVRVPMAWLFEEGGRNPNFPQYKPAGFDARNDHVDRAPQHYLHFETDGRGLRSNILLFAIPSYSAVSQLS